jgi:hypothetical protein
MERTISNKNVYIAVLLAPSLFEERAGGEVIIRAQSR